MCAAASGDLRPSVAVEIPLLGDERRKNWAKVITNVDETHSSGWAFDGTFIAAGGVQDVAVGAVILLYGERGSRSNPQIEAQLLTVNGDATLTHHESAKGRAWARTLRDRAVELLDAEAEVPITPRAWHPDLMSYGDEALHEELRRRKD